MSTTRPRVLDWPSVLAGLAQLQIEHSPILESNVLVGGAACMFYRDQLERIDDPDFRERAYTDEEESMWLSRDADFATTDPGEIPDRAGNVPLGRLQMGLTLGAEEFRENARRVSLRSNDTEFTILIADPLDLWREKEAAVHRLSRPQDSLHLEVLSTTLQWETAHYAEKVAAGSLAFSQWEARLREIRRRWNAILNDERLRARLLALDMPEMTDYVTKYQMD